MSCVCLFSAGTPPGYDRQSHDEWSGGAPRGAGFLGSNYEGFAAGLGKYLLRETTPTRQVPCRLTSFDIEVVRDASAVINVRLPFLWATRV